MGTLDKDQWLRSFAVDVDTDRNLFATVNRNDYIIAEVGNWRCREQGE